MIIRSAFIPGSEPGTSGVQDILIDAERIVAIAPKIKDESNATSIDASGLIALPGGIDIHVHFRTPGNEESEQWVSGSKVALAAGYTTVLDMPNTLPPTISRETLAEKKRMIAQDARVHFGCYIGATQDNLQEIIAAQREACGVKVYYGPSTGLLMMNDLHVLESLCTAHVRIPIVVHAEDAECIQRREQEYHGYQGIDIHGKIRDREAAIRAVTDMIELARRTGTTNLHITHVTTREEAQCIREAKASGVHITADVTPHHLAFDIKDVKSSGYRLKVNPPLRESDDRDALWEGLYDGTIDMVASDHAPHPALLKDAQEYSAVPAGIPSLQTQLLYLLDHQSSQFTLEDIMRVTAGAPAQRFGFYDRGTLKAGTIADITLIDPSTPTHMSEDNLYSRCGWSPWEGKTFSHSIHTTMVAGQIRYQKGMFI